MPGLYLVYASLRRFKPALIFRKSHFSCCAFLFMIKADTDEGFCFRSMLEGQFARLQARIQDFEMGGEFLLRSTKENAS